MIKVVIKLELSPFVPTSVPLSGKPRYLIEMDKYLLLLVTLGQSMVILHTKNSQSFKVLKALNLRFLGTGFGLICISLSLPQF